MLKDGGSARQAAVEKLVGSLGGSVESMYYAFGETDLYIIADMPDNASMAALALVVGASGAVTLTTTILMTLAEVGVSAYIWSSLVCPQPELANRIFDHQSAGRQPAMAGPSNDSSLTPTPASDLGSDELPPANLNTQGVSARNALPIPFLVRLWYILYQPITMPPPQCYSSYTILTPSPYGDSVIMERRYMRRILILGPVVFYA